jgi:hypothetical protein
VPKVVQRPHGEVETLSRNAGALRCYSIGGKADETPWWEWSTGSGPGGKGEPTSVFEGGVLTRILTDSRMVSRVDYLTEKRQEARRVYHSLPVVRKFTGTPGLTIDGVFLDLSLSRESGNNDTASPYLL